MKIIPDIKEVKKFLVIFYIVGILGFIIPQTKELFTKLIPFALLLNFGLLIYFHKPKNTASYIVMAIIALLGFSIEIVGVQTGLVFGSYNYGSALGIKILGTPLMIGVNWLILTYCMAIISKNWFSSKLLSALIGSLVVTFFDVIMEPVAIYTGMWNWGNQPIPIQNYVAWFILSFIFILILRTFSSSNSNKLAGPVFFLQLFFFTGLLVIIKMLFS